LDDEGVIIVVLFVANEWVSSYFSLVEDTSKTLRLKTIPPNTFRPFL
jgi:hypothetical protein